MWLPTGGNPLRLTAEYTDTVPTRDIFSFGDVEHGSAYNNSGYPDGMRYRGRSLGFSLDSDSTLLTLQGAWRDSNGWSYELTLHHAAVSNPNNTLPNAVTSAPVHINMGEARVCSRSTSVQIDLAGRLQDDQPRPDPRAFRRPSRRRSPSRLFERRSEGWAILARRATPMPRDIERLKPATNTVCGVRIRDPRRCGLRGNGMATGIKDKVAILGMGCAKFGERWDPMPRR